MTTPWLRVALATLPVALAAACGSTVTDQAAASASGGEAGSGGGVAGSGEGGRGGDGGGGGAGGEPAAPAVRVVFPPAASIIEEATVTVRGTGAGVTGVRVGGVDATSGDGFHTWTAKVPLVVGPQHLVVDAIDAQGHGLADRAHFDVERGAIVRHPAHLVVGDGRAFAFGVTGEGDGYEVVEIDRVTGTRVVVAGHGVGAGAPLVASNPAGATWDAGVHEIVLVQGTSVVTLDPDTGDRTAVKIPLGGYAGAALAPSGPSGASVITADYERGAILSIDRNSGAVTVVSDATHGAGPPLSDPREVAVLGDSAYVVELNGGRVLAVSLATGDRSIVSDADHGAGPDVPPPWSTALDAAGARLFVAGSAGGDGGIVSVDLTTGDRLGVPANDADWADTLAFDAGELVVTGFERDTLATIDPDAGVVTSALAQTVGDGERFPLGTSAIAHAPALGAYLVVSDQDGSIHAVDAATGARRVVSAPQAGATVNTVFGFAPSSAFAWALVYDHGAPESPWPERVDYATGARARIPDGAGPRLLRASAFAADGGALYVISWDENLAGQLLAIQPATGDRKRLSGPGVGKGPPLEYYGGLVVDGARLLAAGKPGVLAIDRATGDRTMLCASLPGAVFGSYVMLAPGGNTLYVDALEGLAAVDLKTCAFKLVTGADIDLGGVARSPDGLLVTSVGGVNGLEVIDPRTGERAVFSK